MTDAEFTRFLTERGLSAIGSIETMRDLSLRCGVQRWFDFLDIVPLPPVSLFPEQTERFFFLRNPNCALLPPGEFECDFDYHHSGPETHACALERFTALFGKPEKGLAVNTLSETWSFERMSLTIRTFLPERTRGHNDLYRKHPELWHFCRISIDRNWIPPIGSTEAAAVDALGSGQVLRVDRVFAPNPRYLLSWERGLCRVIKSTAAPFLWNDGPRLGWCVGPLLALFERKRCRELTLEQVTPARSSGYSRLVLRLSNPFSLEQELSATAILTGGQTHTLDEVAREVADFWALPLVKIEYPDD